MLNFVLNFCIFSSTLNDGLLQEQKIVVLNFKLLAKSSETT